MRSCEDRDALTGDEGVAPLFLVASLLLPGTMRDEGRSGMRDEEESGTTRNERASPLGRRAAIDGSRQYATRDAKSGALGA
jgi:hypothetical protein